MSLCISHPGSHGGTLGQVQNRIRHPSWVGGPRVPTGARAPAPGEALPRGSGESGWLPSSLLGRESAGVSQMGQCRLRGPASEGCDEAKGPSCPAPGIHSSALPPPLPLSSICAHSFPTVSSLASSAPFLVSSLGSLQFWGSEKWAGCSRPHTDSCCPVPSTSHGYDLKLGHSVISSGPHGVHAGGQQEASNVR